ncbi:MAG: hypothetical protein L6Q98_25235 [Anaerolineae bacterium]|nr:hypothetical protein [Anaerolineae bacterium]NUQ05938.1 helix-turn-helix domain-containing protein [Anaerolineae bacterium]
MIRVEIDNMQFEVRSRVVLCASETGEWKTAPAGYAALALAAALGDYTERDDAVYLGDHHQVFVHFYDEWDAQGRYVGKRDSGLTFPMRAGIVCPMRPRRLLTGRIGDVVIVNILEFDDPLDGVMSTSEVEKYFGLAEGTAKKAAQRRQISARKSGGTWLIRRDDAQVRWG